MVNSTAAAGQDLVQVAKNNVIENITLNADNTQHVIVNDQTSSVGNLIISNVVANTGVAVTIGDGSQDSNIVLKNSIFNMGNVSSQEALEFTLNNGTAALSVTNNAFQFGSGDSNKAVEINSEVNVTGNSTFNINHFDNNIINFADGDSNAGLRVAVADSNGYTTTIIINSLQNNTINFGSGSSNNAISADVSSMTGNGSLTINNTIANQISYTSGTDNNAFYLTSGYFLGEGHIAINSMYDNKITLPEGEANYAFDLLAGTDADSQITINVNDNDNGLSVANNIDKTQINTDGNVTFNPSE